MPPSAQPQSSAPAQRGVVEPENLSLKGVLIFLIGLFVVVTICCAIVAGLFVHYKHLALVRDEQIRRTEVVPSARSGGPYFPSPHEQFSPRLDLQWLKARQEQELNTYGWVDKKAGVVRIPIERAMDLVLQRGLPTRPSNGTAKSGPSSLELQQQRPIQSSPPQKEEGKK